MALQENQLICQGKYHIIRLVGQGAFARVWLAETNKAKDQVAIKELKAEVLTAVELAEQSRRFDCEINVGNQLRAQRVPNVVYSLTTETYEARGSETPLLVLEHMPGGSLLDLLRKHPSGLPVNEAVRIASDLCQALYGVHQLGLVHRDIKPSNILFRSPDGAAHLADFGTAQLPGETLSGGSRSLGTASRHPGTPAYMSPEQRDGIGTLGPTADIFSLGCVIFDMLTGQSSRSDIPTEPPSKIHPGIPPWLDQIVAKCLAEQPAARYQTAEELRQALDAAGKAQAIPPADDAKSAPDPKETQADQPPTEPQSVGPASKKPAGPDDLAPQVISPEEQRTFPNIGDVMQVVLALLALIITWIAFRNPQSFPEGLPDVLTAMIGVLAALATVALSAPLVKRAVRAVRTPGGSPVLEYLALILGTGMILVALVGLVLAFFAFLSQGPGAGPSSTTLTPTLTLTTSAPSSTPTVTLSPIPSTNTWTPSPTASPTSTGTASPVPPSPTPTATRTPIPPTNTWTPTRTPLPPTNTWTPVSTATRPAPTKTPVPQPPTATRRLPTATPKPPTAAPRTYAAPQLVAPANSASFPDGATVTLQWGSIGQLASGDHYLLAVQHGGGTSWVVTDTTSWGVPSWLQAYAPVTWWVAVCRGAALGEYGAQPGRLASPTSETRRFSWNASGGGGGPVTDTPPKVATDAPP